MALQSVSAKPHASSREELLASIGDGTVPSSIDQVLLVQDYVPARGGTITPDPNSKQLGVTKRVIGIPGDTVLGRSRRVFVDGKRADDIPTEPFPSVRLGKGQYFVLGDNRSASEDSRIFGPVPRKAIYGRVVLVFWPVGRFGVPGYNKHLKPPRPLCGAP